MMGLLGRCLDWGWFYSCPSFSSGLGGVKYCWNRCSSNFTFPMKFVIVLLCGLLVDSNTFLKMCVFKMSYWLHWWWWLWKTKCRCCNNSNNKNLGNEEFMSVILNFILSVIRLFGGSWYFCENSWRHVVNILATSTKIWVRAESIHHFDYAAE